MGILSSIEIFALNLKDYRYKLNLSQEKFGSTLSYINQLENARRKPTLDLIDIFANILEIETPTLLTYNPKHKKKIRVDSKK